MRGRARCDHARLPACAAGAGATVTTLGRWSWRAEELEAAHELAVPIELDLAPAITMVATVSAVVPHLEPGLGMDPFAGMKRHEGVLNWWLQDSLDGETWHDLGSGGLYAGTRDPRAVARISSAIGTHARFYLTTVAVAAYLAQGTVTGREACDGRACGIDHHEVRVTAVRLEVAVRSFG